MNIGQLVRYLNEHSKYHWVYSNPKLKTWEFHVNNELRSTRLLIPYDPTSDEIRHALAEANKFFTFFEANRGKS